MKAGYALLAAYCIVLAMGIVFGALAVGELRKTTERMQGVVSDSAARVIEIERVRAASDRLGLSIRSYLLVQNAEFRGATREASERFTERLRALAGRVAGSPSAPLVARARAVHDQGVIELDRILSSERRLSPEESIEAVERRGHPIRQQLEALLDELSETETRAFEGVVRDATGAAARATRLLTALAIIGLAVAIGLTIALLRALRLLAKSRAKLEASMLRLETVNSDLDSFVGRTAHDLRNVIAPLDLIADVLTREGGAPPELLRQAERLKRIGRTANGLLEAYLTFARAGQPPNPSDVASVRQVLAEVVEDLAPIAERERAWLEVSGDDALVLCSPSFLHTILMNLIGNGLKYLDGGTRREVSVQIRVEPSVCWITVSDGGPGIPAGSEARIFEPFYRSPGVQAPGTGIGLATVARIVKAHGGSITVQSSAGQGSTFVVSLPRADAPESRNPTLTEPSGSARSPAALPPTH
jgi:signal transduction histidine kinase